jgi:hypothetical protein
MYLEALRERGLMLATPNDTHQLEVEAHAADEVTLAAGSNWQSLHRGVGLETD